jgi:PadR family transcriptional regulator, regulatory protein PadR
MGKQPRLSSQTIKVLGTLIASPAAELSGAEIAKHAKLASGTLYPILLRLEKMGWLKSRWEAGDPRLLGRPRRRFYRITGTGLKNVEQVVRDLTPNAEVLAWA